MKYKEIKEKKGDELDLLENKLRQELAGLFIQMRTGQLADTAKIGNVRRQIARVLTAKRTAK